MANYVMMDGNEAAAYVAYRTNEVIAIYPITPSSPMGEWCDEWASHGLKNLWETVPSVTELQSEGGAAGAVHGALQTGSLTTTFTASQGLLLMIPNMFKIAGELNSSVFHVAARSVAAQALSIFGDHSDVMATRSTGFALLSSNAVQEVMDFALIAQAASLRSRIPFVHFFDGFRTSHEVMKIELVSDEIIRAMIDDNLVREHRARGLSSDRPVLRGSAQNPDVFFQGREAVNRYYDKCPGIVQDAMDEFAKQTGRSYRLFDYSGAADAEHVIVIMGSGAEAAQETVEKLVAEGEKVGLLKVRLYRPFSRKHFADALPSSVSRIGVLDRTKEPGALGEPLYQDVVSALVECAGEGLLRSKSMPSVIGGRYGLSSKEFTPAMVKAVFAELKKDKMKNHFTVGITDDVTHTNLDFDPSFSTESDDVVRGVFYGLGSDGTVGANKNSVKIIGEGTNNFAQGYFVYDSKKSGSVTVSHLRFGKDPIRSTYLIDRANFIACHQFAFLEKFEMLKTAVTGATFLVNSPFPPEGLWEQLPSAVQKQVIEKNLKLFTIDAYKVATETGMGGRINTIMQTCFFAISGVLPREEAIDAIKSSIDKTYGKKGDKIVELNFNAVDQTLKNLHEVHYPNQVTSKIERPPTVDEKAPDRVKSFTAKIMEGRGDELPVSLMSPDGSFPTGTTQWEKRNIAMEIPVWDMKVCIQCNKCVLVCPHATIRAKVYDESVLADAPETFKSTDYRAKDYHGMKYSLQIAPEDCTGCGLCVDVCPAKNKQETRLKAINMKPQRPIRLEERENWNFFLGLPEIDRRTVKTNTVKGSQFLRPLFEFSGACSGCGETPYLKLVSQLFGDRAIIANATGCSSIYGGNLPTTPWAKDDAGRGPAWSNSLFEDNAEFGMGFRLTVDKHSDQARELLLALKKNLDGALVDEILGAEQNDEAGIYDQRQRVDKLGKSLKKLKSPEAENLLSLMDMLVKKSVWIVGGDGWAYDIGYGGLDHVLASGKNVNVLVLDTEVYSNTGGQMSKATNRAAVAKFAANGKPNSKKDLGLLAMSYGNVYVAQVAMGADDTQTVRAFIEAEAYEGPSLLIAYSHCIAHGINMGKAMDNQKAAVQSGHWNLYRYHPDRSVHGENPMSLDSKAPTIKFRDYAYKETRYRMLTKSNPGLAEKLIVEAQEDVRKRRHLYEQLAGLDYRDEANGGAEETKSESQNDNA